MQWGTLPHFDRVRLSPVIVNADTPARQPRAVTGNRLTTTRITAFLV
jgi:hypothetical protein